MSAVATRAIFEDERSALDIRPVIMEDLTDEEAILAQLKRWVKSQPQSRSITISYSDSRPHVKGQSQSRSIGYSKTYSLDVLAATDIDANEALDSAASSLFDEPKLINPHSLPEPITITEDARTSEIAGRLLHFLVDKKDREVIIGDLFEKYESELEKGGKRQADLWLYREIARSVWPLIRRLVIRISGRIIRTRRAE